MDSLDVAYNNYIRDSIASPVEVRINYRHSFKWTIVTSICEQVVLSLTQANCIPYYHCTTSYVLLTFILIHTEISMIKIKLDFMSIHEY